MKKKIDKLDLKNKNKSLLKDSLAKANHSMGYLQHEINKGLRSKKHKEF